MNAGTKLYWAEFLDFEKFWDYQFHSLIKLITDMLTILNNSFLMNIATTATKLFDLLVLETTYSKKDHKRSWLWMKVCLEFLRIFINSFEIVVYI